MSAAMAAAAAPSPAVDAVSSNSEEVSDVVLDMKDTTLDSASGSKPAQLVVSSVVSRVSLAWRDVYYQVAINDKQTREIRTCISGRLLKYVWFLPHSNPPPVTKPPVDALTQLRA